MAKFWVVQHSIICKILIIIGESLESTFNTYALALLWFLQNVGYKLFYLHPHTYVGYHCYQQASLTKYPVGITNIIASFFEAFFTVRAIPMHS